MKIRCIKDNLARKAVDTRTKVRCYGELRDLYGLKRGNPTPYVNQSGDVITENKDFMTRADMAKEVNLTESTSE